MKSIVLTKLLEMYVDAKNEEREIGHELAPGTVRYYRESIRKFAQYLGRSATTADLTVEALNAFLVHLHDENKSPYGIKARRTALMVLFRFAKSLGLADGEPTRVRRVRCQRLEVEGYTVAQMQSLLATFGGRQGRVQRCGLNQRLYYLSMLVVLWDTGLRIGDIPSVRVDKFNPDGLLWALEHKTGKCRWRRLSAVGTELVAACIGLNPDREFIWPGHNSKSLSRCVNRIIRASGLPGMARWIRRGSSSDVDRLHPGQGWRFLAHSTPSVFENHYRIAHVCDDGSIAPSQLTLS